jgi:DNA-directed RNA polymerase specialized sigma24 family protein
MTGERPTSGADAGTDADTGEARELARARAGDVAAFGALVRRHQERVFRFLHRMLDAREEAMELTQDVFIKAWQALPGWRPEAAFSTWLLQIARNAALDQLRRRKGRAFRAAGGRCGGRRRRPRAGGPLCQPTTPGAARARASATRRRAPRDPAAARGRGASPTASWPASSGSPRAR